MSRVLLDFGLSVQSVLAIVRAVLL
jgi:hypothetical protein